MCKLDLKLRVYVSALRVSPHGRPIVKSRSRCSGAVIIGEPRVVVVIVVVPVMLSVYEA